MMNLRNLANLLGGEWKGDGDLEIVSIKDLEHHSEVDPNALYYIASKKYTAKHKKHKDVRIALTIASLADLFPNAIIVPENSSKVKFILAVQQFEKKPIFEKKISERAVIHPTARIGNNVTIMENVVIQSNVKVGDGCILYPNVVLESGVEIGENTELRAGVVIYYNCKLGKNNLIHSNTVIGADGFGFYDFEGVRYKVPQIGNVVIGDDVEMGANCTVDRAALEETTIGNFTKFDDHVHIGHNCRVGNYVYIAGATVLAGSVTLEDLYTCRSISCRRTFNNEKGIYSYGVIRSHRRFKRKDCIFWHTGTTCTRDAQNPLLTRNFTRNREKLSEAEKRKLNSGFDISFHTF